MSDRKCYVIYCVEYLRDGREEWAKVVNSLEEAQSYLDKFSADVERGSVQMLLFELGRRIPLAKKTTVEPRPPKTTTRLVIGGEDV